MRSNVCAGVNSARVMLCEVLPKDTEREVSSAASQVKSLSLSMQRDRGGTLICSSREAAKFELNPEPLPLLLPPTRPVEAVERQGARRQVLERNQSLVPLRVTLNRRITKSFRGNAPDGRPPRLHVSTVPRRKIRGPVPDPPIPIPKFLVQILRERQCGWRARPFSAQTATADGALAIQHPSKPIIDDRDRIPGGTFISKGARRLTFTLLSLTSVVGYERNTSCAVPRFGSIAPACCYKQLVSFLPTKVKVRTCL